MIVDVANIPIEPPSRRDVVCVVIDVLRASSTITYLFDKGNKEVLLTDEVSAYIAKMKEQKDRFAICAEDVAGHRLDGADFSPSLEEIAQITEFKVNEPILMQTTNGTMAVHSLLEHGLDVILIGCMRNATSVMEIAFKLAQKLDRGIYIACAGRERGTSYTIDDVYCAAHLVLCAERIAMVNNTNLVLNDSAKLALHCLKSYSNILDAFHDSASGAVMRRLNRQADIVMCANEDVSLSVPIFAGVTDDGFLKLVSYEHENEVNYV